MKVLFKVATVVLLLVFVLSSCITSKQTNLLQDIDKDYETIPPPEEYRVIPGDILNVVVYIWDDEETAELFSAFRPSKIDIGAGETSIYGRYYVEGNATDEGTRSGSPIPVYDDGTITFPYLGQIYVADLTILEIRKLITARLQDISANASANVTLATSYFSVIGESGSRRVSMFSNNMTIYQALAISGNISDYTKRDEVTILRQLNGATQIKKFDLRSKDIINTEFYYIQPNDVIYFPQSKGKFFGATTSFAGIFGLVTSFATIIVMALRIF